MLGGFGAASLDYMWPGRRPDLRGAFGAVLEAGDEEETLEEIRSTQEPYKVRPGSDVARRVRRALVISTFLRHADDRTRLFAVQMLSLGNGADTHSREEHTTWLHAAGFTDVTRHPAPGGHDLLVATT